jgi:hypothetical protein
VRVELWSDARVVVQRAQRQTEVVRLIVELGGKSSAGSPLSRGRALHGDRRVWVPGAALRTPQIWRRLRCNRIGAPRNDNQYRRNRPTSLPWMRTRLGGRMRTS